MHMTGTWVIPMGTTVVTKDYVADNMPSGTSHVVISESVICIGWSAFRGYSGLTKIDIPEGVKTIESWAFADCSGLQKIEIPEGVMSIGDSVFSHCINLTQLNIPEGIESVGSYIIEGCSHLRAINMPDGYIWHIPDGVESLTQAYIDDNIPAVTLAVVIPTGVTRIGDRAFYWHSSLTKISIPVGVMSIGDEAFCGCTGLRKVELPEGMVRIEDKAFIHCTGLTHVYLPDQYCEAFEKERLEIQQEVFCISHSEVVQFCQSKLQVEGQYSCNVQIGLYRLSTDSSFGLNDSRVLKHCVVADIMSAISERAKCVGIADAAVLSGYLLGAREDMTNCTSSIYRGDEGLPEHMWSYLTVRDFCQLRATKRHKPESAVQKLSLFNTAMRYQYVMASSIVAISILLYKFNELYGDQEYSWGCVGLHC